MSDIIDEIWAYIRMTEHQHGKHPDIFLCSRDAMDVIKAQAKNGAPIEIRHAQPYGIEVLVFGVSVVVAPNVERIQPYINSAEPKRSCGQTYFDLKEKEKEPNQ